MNSRNKGKVGERELANKLRTFGYDARRGQQYCGISGDADVIGLPGIHIECKRVEKLNIDNAMEQSIRDASYGEKPTVMHRRDRKQWLFTMQLTDWIELYKAWEKDNERTYKAAQVGP